MELRGYVSVTKIFRSLCIFFIYVHNRGSCCVFKEQII